MWFLPHCWGQYSGCYSIYLMCMFGGSTKFLSVIVGIGINSIFAWIKISYWGLLFLRLIFSVFGGKGVIFSLYGVVYVCWCFFWELHLLFLVWIRISVFVCFLVWGLHCKVFLVGDDGACACCSVKSVCVFFFILNVHALVISSVCFYFLCFS